MYCTFDFCANIFNLVPPSENSLNEAMVKIMVVGICYGIPSDIRLSAGEYTPVSRNVRWVYSVCLPIPQYRPAWKNKCKYFTKFPNRAAIRGQLSANSSYLLTRNEPTNIVHICTTYMEIFGNFSFILIYTLCTTSTIYK